MRLTPQAISCRLESLLPAVQKPARYTGGEFNSAVKDWSTTRYRVALVFPDVYDLGMSNLGLAILYDIVNRQPDMLAERAYTPWVDMLAAMRRAGLPLYSLESRHALSDFDVLGFSLPYEQLYTNVLTTLDLAGIPLRAADRADGFRWQAEAGQAPQAWPLILAGGSACLNPEPMHAFFDAFFIGEGEAAILEITRAWSDARRSGLGRSAALLRLAEIDGVYVPSLYEVETRGDGAPSGMRPSVPAARYPVVKRIVPELPPPPTKFVVPFIDVVHNRAAIEIQRGCTRGCRFCQAGMVFRPVRERPVSEVLAAVDDIVRQTGFEEISFLSLSSSDYSQIGDLVREVVSRFGQKMLSIGLPSLRLDSFSVELMQSLEKGRRRSGFTFAPEAATDRLRDVINKPIATETLLETVAEVYRRGWPTVKLYFMIGHPTQTLEDVQAIADLAHQVKRVGYRELGRKSNVRIAVSTLVPKPHTPFQWAPLADEATILSHIKLLERQLRGPGLEFSWNDPQETLLEAALSRGDRRLSNVIQRAWELGAGFDAWGDQLNHDAWRQAFAENDLDPDWYARRERAVSDALPWDHISIGVTKRFLAQEYQRALLGQVTGDCREHCYSCGILGQFKAERRQAGDSRWGCPPLGSGIDRRPVTAGHAPATLGNDVGSLAEVTDV